MLPSLGTITFQVVEKGTRLQSPTTGEILEVDDKTVVFQGSKAFLTDKKFKQLKKRLKQ